MLVYQRVPIQPTISGPGPLPSSLSAPAKAAEPISTTAASRRHGQGSLGDESVEASKWIGQMITISCYKTS